MITARLLTEIVGHSKDNHLEGFATVMSCRLVVKIYDSLDIMTGVP